MRIWLIILLAAVVGSLSGLVIAQTEFAGVVEYFEPVSRAPVAAPHVARPKGSGPRAVVEGGTKFTFETIAYGSSSEHAFQVRNAGDELLKLTFDRPSCGMCIEVEEKYREIGIAPGETADVVVKYGAKKSGESFDEAAYFKTNDPLLSTLRLDITGIVTQAAKLVPNELALGTVSSSDGLTLDVKLLGYRSDTIELLEHSFTDPMTEEFFEVSTQPLSKEEVFKADKYATCGLLAKVTLKPGIPLGTLGQVVKFKLKTADGEHNLELTVNGEVTGDISIVGPDYKPSHDCLALGISKVGEGDSSTFYLFVKGEHRHGLKLSVAELDPAEYLTVNFGEPSPVGNGRTVKYPVTVELSKDTPVMYRWGNAQGDAGRLVIETSHPTASKIALEVRFQVEARGPTMPR